MIRHASLSILTLLAMTNSSPASADASNLNTPDRCENLFLSGEKNLGQNAQVQEQSANKNFYREAAKYFKANLKLPTDISTDQLHQIFSPQHAALTIADLAMREPELVNSVKAKLVSEYLKFTRVYQRTPSIVEFATALGLGEKDATELYGESGLFRDAQEIRALAIEKNPRAFDKVVDDRYVNAAALAKTAEIFRDHQAFLITTAVPYTPVNRAMLATLKTMAKKKHAKIIVMPAFMQTTGLDPILLNDPDIHILVNTTVLNPLLRLDNIKLMPKMLNPDAGLDLYGPRGQSLIVASPQIRLKTVPTIENDHFPHFILTTGAITEPVYNTRIPIQGRTDALAAGRHRMAALLLEKSRGSNSSMVPGASAMTGFFHFRHIRYFEGRGMVDKGTLYTPETTAAINALALIMADAHVGMTDPMYLTKLSEIIRRLKPGYVVLHDVFNGHSISHHDAKNLLDASGKYIEGKLNLEREIRDVATFMNSLLRLDPKLELRVVLSNHDLWINRWLNQGDFMKETHNRAIGIELAAAVVRGESPFEYALKKFGLEYPKRVQFVTNGNWTAGKVQLAQHGHQGANGARNSMLTMVRAADMSVFGHSHTTQIIGDTVNVGTASLLRPGYNGTGPSSWSHSIAAVYDSNVIELFILQKGEWWTSEKVGIDPSFYPQGFPRVIPPTDPKLGPQIDQYSHFAN